MSALLKLPFTDWFRYRELIENLVSQEIKLRYKRTVLGYLWSLLNPILHLAVLSAVFSHFVGRGMENYPQYLFSGLLPWQFFFACLISTSLAILDNEGFIKKVHLPKSVFVLSRMVVRFWDFLLSFVALALLGLVFQFRFGETLAGVPLAAFLLFLFTLGCGMLMSVLTVYLRDINHLLQVFLQLLYFATPILYPIAMLPERFLDVLRLNPLFWHVHLFHKLVYFNEWPSWNEWGVTAALSVAAFLFGLAVLNRLERDVVFRL